MNKSDVRILNEIKKFYAYVVNLEGHGTVMLNANREWTLPGGELDLKKVKVRGYDSDFDIGYALRRIVQKQIGLRLSRIGPTFEIISPGWFKKDTVYHFYQAEGKGNLLDGKVITLDNLPSPLSPTLLPALQWAKDGFPKCGQVVSHGWINLVEGQWGDDL